MSLIVLKTIADATGALKAAQIGAFDHEGALVAMQIVPISKFSEDIKSNMKCGMEINGQLEFSFRIFPSLPLTENSNYLNSNRTIVGNYPDLLSSATSAG